MFCRLTISKYVNHTYKICKTPISFKSNQHRFTNYFKENNEKLYNNIIRARSNIFDYCMCNEFTFFVTLTINPKYNRNDLEWVRKTTSQIIRNLRCKYTGDFKYILIPEQHKDGAWHLHGLFNSDFGKDFYINDYNYLSWASFDKIGFSSISKINNYLACVKYITKYIKKDFEKREKGKHLYFCSNNLIKSNKICDLVFSQLHLSFDYDGDFASRSIVTDEELKNIINYIKKDIYSVLDDRECLL